MSQPQVSVVVCTYNRADILSRCLRALSQQDFPAEEYEILVVDNASTDHTRAVVGYFPREARGPEVRYLFQPQRGLSHARNLGAQQARAPVVTYVDDDAIATPGLVGEMARIFRDHPDAGVAGGRVELLLPEQLPSWYTEYFHGYYSHFDLGLAETTRVTEVWQYPFGANISYLRQALERAGWFNTVMGRVGKDSSGGEEIDATCRVAGLGYGVYYTPHAAVTHIILPSRLRREHIVRSAAAAGRNWAYYEVELLEGRARGLGQDLLALLATVRQLWQGRGSESEFLIAESKHRFQRAKFGRKLQYWLSGYRRQPQMAG
jgi:glycosyltransferase involved in cell wall biosynthesis